jgi:hypothetical protein
MHLAFPASLWNDWFIFSPSRSRDIQTPDALVVHPKMNSGNEFPLPVANADLGLWDARKAVLKPPHSRRWRDHQAFPHRAKRLDCGAFTAAFSLVVHPK